MWQFIPRTGPRDMPALTQWNTCLHYLPRLFHCIFLPFVLWVVVVWIVKGRQRVDLCLCISLPPHPTPCFCPSHTAFPYHPFCLTFPFYCLLPVSHGTLTPPSGNWPLEEELFMPGLASSCARLPPTIPHHHLPSPHPFPHPYPLTWEEDGGWGHICW